MSLTIGIDIGGSSVEAVARTSDGEIVSRRHSRSAIDGGRNVASAAVEAVSALGSRIWSGWGSAYPVTSTATPAR